MICNLFVVSGNVSASEVPVRVDNKDNMEMSYSPVQTDDENSPSKKLPPVEVIGQSCARTNLTYLI